MALSKVRVDCDILTSRSPPVELNKTDESQQTVWASLRCYLWRLHDSEHAGCLVQLQRDGAETPEWNISCEVGVPQKLNPKNTQSSSFQGMKEILLADEQH